MNINIHFSDKFLGGKVVACIVFKEAARLFSRVAVPLHILTRDVWMIQFLSILINIAIFFILANLIGVWCYLIVVLICNSLIANNIEHIFMRAF